LTLKGELTGQEDYEIENEALNAVMSAENILTAQIIWYDLSVADSEAK
jgi:hypothetical protein